MYKLKEKERTKAANPGTSASSQILSFFLKINFQNKV